MHEYLAHYNVSLPEDSELITKDSELIMNPVYLSHEEIAEVAEKLSKGDDDMAQEKQVFPVAVCRVTRESGVVSCAEIVWRPEGGALLATSRQDAKKLAIAAVVRGDPEADIVNMEVMVGNPFGLV